MTGALGTRFFRRRRAAVAIALSVVVAGMGACADEADAPDTAGLAAGELDGWHPLHTYEHDDVVPYDQVAAAPAPDGAVWFTRSEEGDDLAVWTLAAGQTSEEAVGAPDGAAIPVGVAADSSGWTAVAVTRDRPGGTNTGVVVWRLPGVASQTAHPQSLSLQRGVPSSITVGRAGGVSVVAGLVDGRVTTWVAGTSGRGGWSAGTPELGVEPIVSARVAGRPGGFVLAGVARDGRAFLWTSPDGLAWTALDVPDTGGDVAAVGMLAPVGGAPAASGSGAGQDTRGAGTAVAVAWLSGKAADEPPRDATDVVVQEVQGDEVTAYGTISAEPGDGVDRIDVNGANRRGDWLLVAGAAVAHDGSARPGLWAGAGGDWGRSSQDELVDQPDVEFRAVGASGDGALYGVLTERSGIDVHLWRSPAPRSE